MTNEATKILLVDDSAENRKTPALILKSDFHMTEARSGEEALRILQQRNDFSAVILVMKEMTEDGYSFLHELSEEIPFQTLPVLVIAEKADPEIEMRALELGVWEFIRPPYEPQTLLTRLKNAVNRSGLFSFNRFRHMLEFDALTRLYNKKMFLTETETLLQMYPEVPFSFLRLDINRFQLINSFFGVGEGDRLLRYLADLIRRQCSKIKPCTYGRMEGDVFSFCLPTEQLKNLDSLVERLQNLLHHYPLDFNLSVTVGVYPIADRSLPVRAMYDRATVAARQIKGSCLQSISFYSREMSEKLAREQEIVNEMNQALMQKQFAVWYQPKYNVKTGKPAGAEALVRWNHPQKGMIPPSDFIPVFERNGFISKLDHFVWEEVCKALCRWKEQGKPPFPISVNVSRVNLYDPNLVDFLCRLTDQWQVDRSLLQLELTESVYTENTDIIVTSVEQLHKVGFTVLMDDFGSGYSSLNVLKNINIDCLKIDMRFFGECSIPGRGENIIASVIRMAKWLNLSTVAEGVEKVEQADFLREIGCEYIQGYFYARPMPRENFEELLENGIEADKRRKEEFNLDGLWSSEPQMELLFSGLDQAVGIFEFDGTRVQLLRANEKFTELLGWQKENAFSSTLLASVRMESRSVVMEAFRTAAEGRTASQCEYRQTSREGISRWIRLKLKYISSVDSGDVLLGTLTDVTAQKSIERELQKYRTALSPLSEENKILVVDDSVQGRLLLKDVFGENHCVLEADNGKDALRILEENNYQIRLILLGLAKQGTDGIDFLRKKQQCPEAAAIPTVVITSDNSPQQQINALNLGADDYIVKPFVREIMQRRVKNVLDSHQRFREILTQYHAAVYSAQTDAVTGLINRSVAEEIVAEEIQNGAEGALVLFEIDRFKRINDTLGPDYGDFVLSAVAEAMKRWAPQDSMLARMGGDEFGVFLKNTSAEAAQAAAEDFCRIAAGMSWEKLPDGITLSGGIAAGRRTTDELLKNSAIALQAAKKLGRNRALIYSETVAESVSRREWLMEAIDSAVLLWDSESREVLYASDAAMQLLNTSTYQGKHCYELLRGNTEPCRLCMKRNLSENRFHTWMEENLFLKRRLVLHGKLLEKNNNCMQLLIMDDITDMGNFPAQMKQEP